MVEKQHLEILHVEIYIYIHQMELKDISSANNEKENFINVTEVSFKCLLKFFI